MTSALGSFSPADGKRVPTAMATQSRIRTAKGPFHVVQDGEHGTPGETNVATHACTAELGWHPPGDDDHSDELPAEMWAFRRLIRWGTRLWG